MRHDGHLSQSPREEIRHGEQAHDQCRDTIAIASTAVKTAWTSDFLKARGQAQLALCPSRFPLARTSLTIERICRTRTPSAISTSTVVVNNLVTLPTRPPLLTTVSPRRNALNHFLVPFHPLLLRPNTRKYMITIIRMSA